MTFSQTQIDALKAPLNSKNVRQRDQAGRKLSYIEGWKAIEEANRIFGFDAWDRETTDIRLLGERVVADKNRIAYMARVRITVRANGALIIRDGCGYGSGIDKDIGQAHESALKEAETDAMKRALMTFGNPFGLALYDKDQANVIDGDAPMTVPHMLTEIEACKGDVEALEALKAEDAFRKGYRNASKADQARILAALNPKVEAAE